MLEEGELQEYDRLGNDGYERVIEEHKLCASIENDVVPASQSNTQNQDYHSYL